MLKIGVVGYSTTEFDEVEAREVVCDAFDMIVRDFSGTPYVVSGLTNIGVPRIAYEEADSRGWKTVGIACAKAFEFDLYPVDEQYIVGDEWGDESERFLSEIDVLIRVGGGRQSIREVEMAEDRGIDTYEFQLNN